MTDTHFSNALAIVSGLLARREAIVSNDEQWRRRLAPLFRDFRWIHLSNYLNGSRWLRRNMIGRFWQLPSRP